MRKLLIPLLAAIALPTAVNAGVPESRNVWMEIDLKPGHWRVDTSNAKASGSNVTVGTSRQQEKDENAWKFAFLYQNKIMLPTTKIMNGISYSET